MGALTGEREVRLDELSGKLTAVTGDNGAGKTTFLELLVGAVYRETPTRGSLMDLAFGRDSLVEVDVEHDGRQLTVRQVVDKIARKQEALLLANGEPVAASTKVSAVDAVVARLLPPRDLVLVSTFAAQQSTGFVAAKPAERKALLLRLLGMEAIEQRHAQVKAAALAAQQAFDAATAKAQQLEASIGDRATAQAAVDAAEHALAVATRVKGELDAAHRASVLAGHSAAEHNRRVDEQLARWREADSRRATAQAKLDDLTKRISNNREIQGKAEQIRAAVLRATELRATAEGQRSRLEQLERDHEARVDEKGRVKATLADLERRAAQLDAQLARLAEARSAAEALPQAEQVQATAAAHLSGAERLALDLDRLTKEGADVRIGGLRQGLASIRDSHTRLDAAQDTARLTLQHDDKLKVAEGQQLQQRDAASRAVKASREALDQLTEAVRRKQLLAASVPDLERVEVERAEVSASITSHTEQLEQATLRIAGLAQEMRGLSPEYAKTVQAIELADRDAKQSVALERSEARIAELEPLARDAAAEVAVCVAERDRIELLDKKPEPLLDASREALAEVERRVLSHTRELGRVQAALDTATKGEAELQQARDATLTTAEALADWRRLDADLGRNGLQAMVIDAALPELNTLANDLLHQSFGTRFTLDVRTQSASADGKRAIEVLEVWVIDTGEGDKPGREGPIETFSGGEGTILREGLSLALTTLAARSTGIHRPTLVRDEAGSALDAAKGRAWIAMLRQAADLIGADRVLFVTHDEGLKALADSRIEL